jgi:hypothetical protein
MKKIFELQPFINIERNQDYQTDIADVQAVGIGC